MIAHAGEARPACRFAKHNMRLFSKHGIENIGLLTIGPGYQ